MKRTSLSAFALALGLATCAAASTSFEPIKVTLPYSVTFGGTTFEPGDYMVVDVRDDGGSSVIELRSSDTGHSALALANRINTPDTTGASQTELVMHHAGDTYEVQRIFVKGCNYGFEMLSAIRHE